MQSRALRRVIVLAVVVLTSGWVLRASAQLPYFDINLQLINDSVSSGAIIVKAELKNNSSSGLYSSWPCIPGILLKDSSGTLLPHDGPLELKRITILPGQAQACKLVISDLYKLLPLTRYTIQMEREGPKGTIAKSNVITFTTPARK